MHKGRLSNNWLRTAGQPACFAPVIGLFSKLKLIDFLSWWCLKIDNLPG
jgi:hypothetical protein